MDENNNAKEELLGADEFEPELSQSYQHNHTHHSGGGTYNCSIDDHGAWTCVPYKQQIIQQEIDDAAAVTTAENDESNDIIQKLNQLGVKVYVINSGTSDFFGDIKEIIHEVSNEDRRKPPGERERCILYRDRKGRVFNLTLRGDASGLAGTWRSLLISFSGVEAMAALMVLTRAFACAAMGDTGVRPAYLSLILGLVLTEEISLSWLNASMLVWGMPSISAYSLLSYVTSDWPRKITVFSLALAGAATSGSAVQRYITIFGVACACVVLCANLGSRAWRQLKLRPIAYGGCGASVVAFGAAVVLGLAVPYIGYREVKAGGKVALETILQSAVFVAVIFVLSDFDQVQRFVIVGSENCSQDAVNISVGIWWTITLILSISLCKRIAKYETKPQDEEEPLLVEDQESPVGYKVPNLPDFRLDQTLNAQPYSCCTYQLEVALGVIMALGIGALIVSLAFTDVDDWVTGS